MAIVKMKRLRLIGLLSEKDALIRRLQDLGALEVQEYSPEEELEALLKKPDTNLQNLRDQLLRMGQALGVLDKYAKEKTGLLPEKGLVSHEALFAPGVIEPGMEVATEILAKEEKISRLYAQISQLEASKTALLPWQSMDVPLETQGTKQTIFMMGTIPSRLSYAEFEQQFQAEAGEAALFCVEEGKESHYIMVLCHRLSRESVISVLRGAGFTQLNFTEAGTATQRVGQITSELEELLKQQDELKAEISGLAVQRDVLKLAFDRASTESAQEAAKERLLGTSAVFSMEAWFEAQKQEDLSGILGDFSCAWETEEPSKEEYDQVPVKLQGNALTNPLNMVTEMYGLPAYSGIDPNGLIMPFFTLFFGIMYADLGYGIILTLAALFLRRKRLSRGMKNAMNLLLQVGITTAVFGALFGGFFGDLIPVFSETFLAQRYDIWALIDPMNDPMVLMIAALIIGGVQLIIGMIVSMYMSIRDGRPLDGILDIVPWWVLFIGVALLALGHGAWLALVGVGLIVLTQGRDKPTIVGKLVTGVAKLYDITGYLGDILSYIRLMALLLATSVIASVVNLLGSMAGGSGGVLGIIGFALVFLIGHGFNMGLNIIGTFVHSARLQFLEFFGKFYKDGGRAFRPLQVETKYHDIKK